MRPVAFRQPAFIKGFLTADCICLNRPVDFPKPSGIAYVIAGQIKNPFHEAVLSRTPEGILSGNHPFAEIHKFVVLRSDFLFISEKIHKFAVYAMSFSW